ncbi:MAG: tRNA (cytidine(56)-2'-O)-methyltransferase [Candidatus Micrarchaeota archaeon]
MNVTVLRLGHRKERDKRITTHCALVARAFGARKIILSGEKDEAIMESVSAVVKKWGGPFEVVYEENWRKTLKNYKGYKVHLTMYGQKLPGKAKKQKNLLVVIGAGKVPGEVYKMVDANVAVGSQPHSEVAALAAFLLKTLGEKPLWRKMEGAKAKIIPQKNSKRVVTTL